MAGSRSRFLIVDYNLSRVEDVRSMAEYARRRYGVSVTLIRDKPNEVDLGICEEAVDLDPLRLDFVEAALRQLGPRRDEFAAGVVFSDNAVCSGAELLSRLGLQVDSPELALGAFSKYEYRRAEARAGTLLAAQRVRLPDFAPVASLKDLHAFAMRHPDGFVLKPMAEGNNRGVVVVRRGDDLRRAFAEVRPYLAGGLICEEFIPYRREFSVDGLGSISFITEKVSAAGRYPVEVAQVVPAQVGPTERRTLDRLGRQVNWLVGQCDGPFHNEIKLSDDGLSGAVVEPNRRPAGMKIWSLARWVYGFDFYHRWVDSAFGVVPDEPALEPRCTAAAVMLGVKSDRFFSSDLVPGSDPFAATVAATVVHLGLDVADLRVLEFHWLFDGGQEVHATPRDNGDFAALGCVALTSDQVDIRAVVQALRDHWLDALDSCSLHHHQAV